MRHRDKIDVELPAGDPEYSSTSLPVLFPGEGGSEIASHVWRALAAVDLLE